MPTSSGRMGWPIPDENVDPWYNAFVGLINSIDSSGYAARENAGVQLMGGGQFSFQASTGVMTWANDIQILAAITGYQWILPANEVPGGGTITLQNGQMMYVNLVRAPMGNTTLMPVAGFQLPNTDNALLIAIRMGNKVYFRNGGVLVSGSPADIIDEPSSGGGGSLEFQQGGVIVGSQSTLNFAAGATVTNDIPNNRIDVSITSGFGTAGQYIRRATPIAINEMTANSTYVIAGDFGLNPVDYALTGLTTNIYFVAVASVAASYLTGTVILYDLTAAAQITSFTYTGASLTPTQQTSTALSLTSANHIYEVRYYVSGGSLSSDQVFLAWAGFQIDQVFP